MSRRGGAGGVPGSLTVGVEGAEDDDGEDLEDFFLFFFILDLFGWYSALLALSLDSAAPDLDDERLRFCLFSPLFPRLSEVLSVTFERMHFSVC